MQLQCTCQCQYENFTESTPNAPLLNFFIFQPLCYTAFQQQQQQQQQHKQQHQQLWPSSVRADFWISHLRQTWNRAIGPGRKLGRRWHGKSERFVLLSRVRAFVLACMHACIRACVCAWVRACLQIKQNETRTFDREYFGPGYPWTVMVIAK